MAVQVPTPDQIKAAATEVGLSLTDADIQSYIELMKPNIHAYNVVDAMPDYLPVVRYPRTPGSFPPKGLPQARCTASASRSRTT